MSRDILIVFFLLALTGITFSATYYTASDGNDQNPGTIDEPWRTISMAARTLEPGDTVLICEGTYREAVNPARSGTADEPIVYAAFPGERVVVSGSNEVADWERDGDGNRYSARINFAPYPRFYRERDPRGNFGGLVMQNGAKMNYAMETGVDEVDEPGEYFMNDSGDSPYTLYVVVRDLGEGFNPNEYSMEIGRVNHVFNLDGGEDYIVVKKLELRAGNDGGISAFNSVGCVYDGLKSYSHYITGIYLKNGTEEHEIRDCEFWDNGHGGIELARSHSNWIHHNLFLSRDQGDGLGGNGAHMWLGPVGQSANDNLIEYNIGLLTGSDYIHSCFIAVQGSRNTIRHNSAIDYHMGGIALLGGAENVVIDNIIYRTFGPCINVFVDAVEGGGHIIRYNDFYSSGIGTSFAWNGRFYNSLEEWEDASGQSANIDGDPQFVDGFNEDLRLTRESPCIDAGDPERPPDPDGTRADMGALYFHQRDIEVEPDQLEFAGVQTGTIDSLALLINNSGLTTLRITSMWISPLETPFYIWWEQEFRDIEPEGSYTEWVKFAPGNEGEFRAVLTIESDDPDEELVEIPIIGTALGVDQSRFGLPTEYSIAALYPNPFNSVINIVIGLPHPAELHVTIHDILGCKAAVLADDRFRQGYNHFSFDAQKLSSGVYFIHADAPGNLKIIRKVILMR